MADPLFLISFFIRRNIPFYGTHNLTHVCFPSFIERLACAFGFCDLSGTQAISAILLPP